MDGSFGLLSTTALSVALLRARCESQLACVALICVTLFITGLAFLMEETSRVFLWRHYASYGVRNLLYALPSNDDVRI
jgi:hypothetical protein